MKARIWISVLGVLILVAGLVGIGYLVYSAGVAQGAAGLEPGDFAPPMYAPRPFLTGLLGFLLLLFLIKFVSRLFLFPVHGAWMHRRMWGEPMRDPHGKDWNWDMDRDPPQIFMRWHEQAHAGEASTEERNPAGE